MRDSGFRRSRDVTSRWQDLLSSFTFFLWPVQTAYLLYFSFLPGRRRGQNLRQKRHAINRPHGNVEGAGYIHRHGGRYCNRVGNIHGCCGWDIDGGDVDRPGDGHRMLQSDWRSDVHCVGAYVHLCSYSDSGIVVGEASVHCRGNGGSGSHRCGRGRVADLVALWRNRKVLDVSFAVTQKEVYFGRSYAFTDINTRKKDLVFHYL